MASVTWLAGGAGWELSGALGHGFVLLHVPLHVPAWPSSAWWLGSVMF